MNRDLTDHKINPCNEAIRIETEETPRPHGVNSRYRIGLPKPDGHGGRHIVNLVFQEGPVTKDENGAVRGVNGITHEVLLAILIDRLKGFQSGPFACDENGEAILHLVAAKDALAKRTQRRTEEGVEGTHEVSPSPVGGQSGTP